jgi:hypothetical protein
MLQAAVQAEREGYEGIITGCAGDPGLDAARELVRIPVVNPLVAAVKLCEVRVCPGLFYSPLSYLTPPKIAAGIDPSFAVPIKRGSRSTL